MSATMPDSVIDKAVLAITKLQGRDDWLLWSATIRIALGQMLTAVNPPHLLMMLTQSMKHGPQKIVMLTGDYSSCLATMSNKPSSSTSTAMH